MNAAAKPRHTLNEKVKWDGGRSTFDTYKNSIEGHLLQVGAGYLTRNDFQLAYEELGENYFSTEAFYTKFRVSTPQAHLDRQYLYGILKSSLKVKSNVYLHRFDSTKDGIKVWIAWVDTYTNKGSNKLRID